MTLHPVNRVSNGLEPLTGIGIEVDAERRTADDPPKAAELATSRER
jgi:hypothetical protein